MNTVKDVFYFVEDIMALTGLSKSKSYKIIAQLNRELEEAGYCTIAGRVAKSYFKKRFYGFDAEAEKPAKKTRKTA